MSWSRFLFPSVCNFSLWLEQKSKHNLLQHKSIFSPRFSFPQHVYEQQDQIYSLYRIFRYIFLVSLFRQTKHVRFYTRRRETDLWNIFDSDFCYELQVCESNMHVAWVWDEIVHWQETEYIYSLQRMNHMWNLPLCCRHNEKQKSEVFACLFWNIFRKPDAKQVDCSPC